MNRGPNFDKFLMRTKDIIWLLGMLWAIIVGIGQAARFIDRIKELQGTIVAQNIILGNLQGDMKEIKRDLAAIRYPDRYGRRRRDGDDGE